MNYRAPAGDGWQQLKDKLDAIELQLRNLQRADGTQTGSLVGQVQAALANINATVAAAISANSYTKTQIDAKIASPGAIAPTNVNASGRVTSAGVINSPGTKANTVTVGFSAVYADSAGDFGANTSSRRYKQDITPIVTDTQGFLGLTTYKFRYIANVEAMGDQAPWDYGLIAEEVALVAPWACFYEEDGTTVRGINYDRLIIAAMNVLQDHERRLQAAGI